MYQRGGLKINAGFRTLSEKRNSWVISPTYPDKINLSNAPPFRVILLLHTFFKVSWISGQTFTGSGINPAGRITANSIPSSSSPPFPILTKAAET